jgi:hypothetical protein
VSEEIFAATVGSDEAKTFSIVKPFDCSCCHLCSSQKIKKGLVPKTELNLQALKNKQQAAVLSEPETQQGWRTLNEESTAVNQHRAISFAQPKSSGAFQRSDQCAGAWVSGGSGRVTW